VSAASNLDPLLLVAVARQESLFDRDARSSAGARGLMQLMPATAASLAGGTLEDGAVLLPDVNIDLGARHLRALLGRYDGRLIPSIAAYNAGADSVAKWQARLAGIAGDEFVERISYRETRGYVKAVLANYRAYLTVYGPSEAQSPRLF
jgi:soluble lytic murein transglycosylase